MKRSFILGFLMLFAAMGVASAANTIAVSANVEGAKVVLINSSSTRIDSSTIASGTYTFTSVTNGSYTVEASFSGYVTQTSSTINVSTDDPTTSFTLVAATISGTVNVANTKVVLINSSSVRTDSTTIATAGASYSFTLSADGAYTVEASASGYVTQTSASQTLAGTSLTADFTLVATPTTYTIGGTILPAATYGAALVTLTPAGGTAVTATTSATDGSYSFAGLTDGIVYALSVSSTGYVTQTSSVTLAGADLLANNFTLVATVTTNTYSGIVMDNLSSAGLDSVQVALLRLTSTQSFLRDTTDATGAFSMTTDSVGTYKVRVKYYKDTTLYATVFDTITLTGTSTIVDTIKLVAAVKSSVAGTVTDSSTGAAIENVIVSVGSYKDTTDAAGAYLVSNVSTGAYTVTATKTGYTSKSTSVTVTATALTGVDFALVSKPVIVISGIVMDTAGTLLDSVYVSFRISATATALLRDTTGTDGAFSITTDSLTGTYLLKATDLKSRYTTSVYDTIVLASVNIIDTIVMGTATTRIIQNWIGVKAKQSVCVSNGILKLNNMANAGTVRMFNSKGELMLSQSFPASANVNLAIGKKLSTGNYILRITQKNAVIQKNIIVQ